MRGISLLAANGLASQEELCCMEYLFPHKTLVSRKANGNQNQFQIL